MKKIILSYLFILLLSLGCTEVQIKPDPSLSAVSANYPTAEFIACGTRWHGLGICPLYSRDYLDSIQLKVQGYFDGDIRVFASNSTEVGCQMDNHFTYRNSELIEIPLPKIASSCTFSISVTPHFPNQDNQSSVVTKTLPGFLRVRKLNFGDFWTGDTIRNPENGQIFFNIPTADNGISLADIRGCGVVFDGVLTASQGKYLVDLNSKGFVPHVQLCTLEGVIFGNSIAKWSRLIAIYNEAYVPLPKPVVISDDREITVYADPTVSAIFFDNEFKLSNQGEFPFDSTKSHVMRLLTSSARSVIGEYDPKNEVWVWK